MNLFTHLSIFFLLSITSLERVYAIEVLNATPTPNYHLTENNNDLKELVDGLTMSYPAWTKKESVGWQKTREIKLTINLGRGGGHCHSGILKLKTSKNKKNDVYLPRRIDIYEEGVHIQEVIVDGELYLDGQAHDIPIGIKDAGNVITAVVHSTGFYIMIDEITWESKAGCNSKKKNNQKTRVNALNDSRKRLAKSLYRKANSSLKKVKNLTVWFANPWGKLPVSVANTANIYSSGKGVKKRIAAFTNTKQVFVLGLVGGCGVDGNYKIQIDSPPELKDKIGVFNIKSQLAYDGSLVYDPLIPLINTELPCSENKASYLWFNIDLNDDVKPKKIRIKVTAGQQEVSGIQVDLDLAKQPETQQCWLNAVNWAYPQDKPIWSSKSDLYQDLHEHGINVFVIHPEFLSMPIKKPADQWIKRKQIINQIKKILAKNSGAKILFYMALDSWLNNTQLLLSKETQRELVSDWVRRMDEFLILNGLSRNQWALYPVDEPFGERIDQLIWVAEIIKNVNNGIQIYANPISVYKNGVTFKQLKQLNEYVDIFQPSFQLAKEQQEFFKSLNKPWWIYEVPKSPAKKVEPNFYRALPLKAWVLEAQGTGFWSYSDTSNGSAWDDFDGMRTDWAVVYEGSQGNVISSRRWEAFAKGIEDYKIFCGMLTADTEIQKAVLGLKKNLRKSLNDSQGMSKVVDQFWSHAID
jgi:hypothetical protein